MTGTSRPEGTFGWQVPVNLQVPGTFGTFGSQVPVYQRYLRVTTRGLLTRQVTTRTGSGKDFENPTGTRTRG